MIKVLPGADTIETLGDGSWTYDMLVPLGETKDQYEIIDGVLYMSPSPHAARHQRAVGRFFRILSDWVDDHQLGEAFIAPTDVVVSPKRVLQPDISFVRTEHLKHVSATIEVVPDLVVEVISPSSQDYDRVTKYALYEEMGVQEYWLLDPMAQSVEVFFLEGGRYTPVGSFGAEATAHSRLLEGFDVAVISLFA